MHIPELPFSAVPDTFRFYFLNFCHLRSYFRTSASIFLFPRFFFHVSISVFILRASFSMFQFPYFVLRTSASIFLCVPAFTLRCLYDLPQSLHQLWNLDGLCQMSVHSSFQRQLFILFKGIGCHCNNRNTCDIRDV